MNIRNYLGNCLIVIIISVSIQVGLVASYRFGTDLITTMIYSLPSNLILVWLIKGKTWKE